MPTKKRCFRLLQPDPTSLCYSSSKRPDRPKLTSFDSVQIRSLLTKLFGIIWDHNQDPLRQRSGTYESAFSGAVRRVSDRVSALTAGNSDAELASRKRLRPTYEADIETVIPALIALMDITFVLFGLQESLL